MNADEMQTKEFEQRASALLGESVTRVNTRVRSQLNQARHAALAEVSEGRSFWRSRALMPATGAVAAAVLVALLVTAHFHAERPLPLADGQNFDDIEMLADTEGLDLLENEGTFYEWAAGQSEQASIDGTTG
jgi:anti-sigma-K factor RskA